MTIEVSRRQLLASASGAALASFALPPNLRKMLSRAPPSLVSSQRGGGKPLSEIKHVVVLMQENRSFDHYFGTMPPASPPANADGRLVPITPGR